jgi:putative two-component system response regulator
MSSPTASPSFNLRGTLTIEEALQTLDAMLCAERAFDSDVVARIEELFRTLPDERASIDLVQGLLNVQLLWYQQMLSKRTVPAGLKAVRWSRQLGDRALLGKALTYRAAFAVENDDLSTGFEALVEALQIGKEIGDVNRIATCYNNLDVIMTRLGRYRAALACIESSLEWCNELTADPGNVRANAMNLLSDLQLRQGDWRAALDSARAAQGLFGPAKGDRSHYACSIHNEVSALVHLRDFESASEAIERLSTLAQQHPSAYTESLLSFAVAEYEGFLGNTTLAEKTLRVPGYLPDKEDALRVLVDIYEHAGELDKALEVTVELLDHLRSARYEVTEGDIRQIDLATLDPEDDVIRELLGRSARFDVEAHRFGDRFQAKLAYLFELAVSAELREEDATYAGEHIYRVGRLCAALASEADCGEEICWLAEIAGRAHDVGKTSLPSHVILKTELLTDGEKGVLRSHAEDSAALVAQLAEPRLVQVVAAVRHHHESWNGSGYPSRLSGEEIPLLARIVALCDSFDAMTHSRPYRSARSVADSLEEVERCAGSQFDPRLAGLFVNLVRRLQREHGDLDEYLGEPGRRTRWAKSHPELMRLLEERRDA